MLSGILRNNDGLVLKLGQLIEYYVTNFSLKNYAENKH